MKKDNIAVYVIYDPATNDLNMFLAGNTLQKAKRLLKSRNKYWGNTSYILVGEF